jgi:hypothetical protein
VEELLDGVLDCGGEEAVAGVEGGQQGEDLFYLWQEGYVRI